LKQNQQSLTVCGVGTHHQSGIAERRIWTLCHVRWQGYYILLGSDETNGQVRFCGCNGQRSERSHDA
jgi:hypothetical protein